jgi:hypothetical protein
MWSVLRLLDWTLRVSPTTPTVIDQPDVVAEQLQKLLGANMRRRPSGALTSE